MTQQQLSLPAPAKINLFLHITGRRADGYHQLQTLFQLLDYGDQLDFQRRDDSTITLSPAHPAIAEKNNLVYRAAKALQQLARQKKPNHHYGADIHLHKRLPLGGGLGGGSSDAATTLIGLNHLWQLDLSREQLAALGLELGADVPVFIHGRTAWAEGIGEILSPVDTREHWYLVLAPNCEVSTATIFSHQQLTRDARAITIRAFLGQGGRNVCQPIAEKLYPEVKTARKWLEQYATVRMTGTGACIFASFESEAQARKVLVDVPQRWQAFVARGVNHSPAYQTGSSCK
ncbi:MAG: 4-(cytidine 5'-diphospho)-2-C-methyl-D-erythritol kinase [Gammaproteobacteria bacterium]|nr:4-(cytidine 5'-diphospho)-2-C-methyl-D-erythritol kinase [Gammaproteobacteria bacterium]MBQ0839555.1 4-(cytidine 5'-diphospho)-2-C-methyl-D-erythritol kinase [Gammaproteobacteria bacterium]